MQKELFDDVKEGEVDVLFSQDILNVEWSYTENLKYSYRLYAYSLVDEERPRNKSYLGEGHYFPYFADVIVDCLNLYEKN